MFLLGLALMRAFEEALHALKHIKSFQGNQLWRKEQCESFSKHELQIQNFQVGRMNCYKPTVLSVPTTWAFRWALDSRIPTSSVWRRQFEYRGKKFFQFITTRQEFILGDHGSRHNCFTEDSHYCVFLNEQRLCETQRRITTSSRNEKELRMMQV